jgi:hypothetical protein
VAATNWTTLDGSSEEDLMRLPLDRFCNRVLAFVSSRMKPEQYRHLLFQIDVPPPGATPISGPWSEEAMAATFAERL